MTKTILSLLFLGLSAFGQDKPVFKEFFDHAVTVGQKDATEIEKLLPIRDKAFTDLSATLNDPTPSKVRENFDSAWDAELKMDTLVFACKSDAEQIRDNTKTALEYKDITPEQSVEALQLATRLDQLAKAGEPKPDQISLRAKVFAYSFKESDKIMGEMRKTADLRKKASEDLAKKLDGDKVKTEVYATRYSTVHSTVIAVAEQERSLERLLWHVEYYFKDGQMTEKEYDKAQQLLAKMKITDELKWAPKDQLAIYKQAAGESALVSLIMK